MSVIVKGTFSKFVQWITFSSAQKVIGLILAVLTAVQALREPSITVALHDILFWMTAVGAVQTFFFTKSNGAHGTSSAPITPEAAAVIAAVVPTLPPVALAPPVSYVGEQIAPGFYSAKPGDPTLDGVPVSDPRGKFLKHVSGGMQYYTPA